MIEFIRAYICMQSIFYLMCSFISLDFNLTVWSENVRFLFVGTIVVSVIAALFISMAEHESRDNWYKREYEKLKNQRP